MEKIPCTTQPPITVTLPKGFQVDGHGNKSVSSLSGLFSIPRCLFFDVIFKQATTIEYITFQNYYTSTITIDWLPNGPIQTWNNSIIDYRLMKSCHSEQGAQENVILGPDELNIIEDAVQLRVILKQPSFQWKEYNIHDFSCYK